MSLVTRKLFCIHGDGGYIFIRFPLRISIPLLISDLSGATLRAPHEDLFIATRRDYLAERLITSHSVVSA